jgi:hypothetical protein
VGESWLSIVSDIKNMGVVLHGLDLTHPKLLIPLDSRRRFGIGSCKSFFILGKISAKRKRSEIKEACNQLKEERAGSNRRPWGYESPSRQKLKSLPFLKLQPPTIFEAFYIPSQLVQSHIPRVL